MQKKVEKAVFEKFAAKDWKVGIVTAQFNRDVTLELEKTAVELLKSYAIEERNLTICPVAGCVEIPVVLNAMAKSGKFDALVAIGAIIRGETPHFDYVAKIACEGVLRVSLDYGIPIGFAVLTLENQAQAENRYHVGAEAAEAALQSVKTIKELAK